MCQSESGSHRLCAENSKAKKSSAAKIAVPKTASSKSVSQKSVTSKTVSSKTAADLKQARLRILELERDLQHARLDLDDANIQLNAALHDLSLLSQQANEIKDAEFRSRFGSLFQDLSAPLAQLLTQNYLQTVQGKSLNGKDVQTTLQRLIQNLKKHGLEIVEEVGSNARFDPFRHEALDLNDTIKEGEDVLVRMCGISFAGKVLRRASVSKLRNPE